MGRTLFLPLFRPGKRSPPPYFLCTTASDSKNDHRRLENVAHLKFPPASVLRSSSSDFAQRSICMSLSIGKKTPTLMSVVVRHLASHDSSVFIFANTKVVVDKATEALEKKIAERCDLVADIVQIIGNMSKKAKNTSIRLFTGAIEVSGMRPRICAATGAGEMGVHHPNAQMVMNLGFVEDVSTYVQRRGRASRNGQRAFFHMDICLSSYVYISRRNEDTNTQAVDLSDESQMSDYNNTELTSPNKKGPLERLRDKYKPTEGEAAQTRAEVKSDFLDVLDLCCLSKGCVHQRIEDFCHTGVLAAAPSGSPGCGNNCPVCSGDFAVYFLPLSFAGLCLYLERSDVLHNVTATSDSIIKSVWGNDEWTRKIFIIKTVKRYNIEGMFLQLIAARLIETSTMSGVRIWRHTREDELDPMSEYRYKNLANWGGIRLTTALSVDQAPRAASGAKRSAPV